LRKKAYGQYCGFARALELVGERWALLVVRDLLVGAKRFSDLQRSLPGIPTNILTARLKEMEAAGVVRRRLLPRPSAGVVYELTEMGSGLKPAVYALGRWGATLLGDPRPTEIVTPETLVTALHTTFQPKAAKGVTVSYELRFGPVTIHARVKNGVLTAAEGALPAADAIVEPGPAFRALLAREVTPREALTRGDVRMVRGSRSLLDTLTELFRIEARPA
jgi:DNA-binding HxlR family transcriptional regulator